MNLTKKEPTKEEISQAIERLMNGEGELIYKEIPPKKMTMIFLKLI